MSKFRFVPANYPTQPGCYVMRDAQGRVLYVGKAKNLRRRLCSYFQPSRRGRTRRLAKRIDDIEAILLYNETESFILESHLIARYQPSFNRAFWRADVGYPYIVLTAEPFPRLVPYHRGHQNLELGSATIDRRFGPFLNLHFRDVVLSFVSDRFQLRTCDPMPREVCLRYHMHKCSGPCADREAAARYVQSIAPAVAFLENFRHTNLLQLARRQMWEHAERLEFEQAARLRTQIDVLERALEQQLVEREVAFDQDVLYFGAHGALVAPIRGGILQGFRLCALDTAPSLEAACERFVLSRYQARSPRELIANCLPRAAELQSALSQVNGYAIRLVVPKRGVKRELVELCRLNYEYRAGTRAESS